MISMKFKEVVWRCFLIINFSRMKMENLKPSFGANKGLFQDESILTAYSSKKEEKKIENLKSGFGPESVVFDKDLFLAEYNSLRGEILQRIGQQTTLYQIDIAAFGVILGYALEKTASTEIYNDVLLICTYPFLAFLLSSAWAFNQLRICQIAQYLRVREEQVSKFSGPIWWENHVKGEPSILDQQMTKENDLRVNTFFLKLFDIHRNDKNKPGIMILIGTQIASILVSIVILIHHSMKEMDYRQLTTIIMIIAVNIVITIMSAIMIKKSGWA
jgi:hypothetical protein